jgi:multidrug resistance efflux pump
VEEGQHVAAGQVMAEIENLDLKAQVMGAEAALMVRESELLRLKTGARQQEIAEAKAAVREAEAIVANARSNDERQNALGARQIVSTEAVEKAHAERASAEAHRDLLAQRLALLAAPPRVEDVAIAQAQVKAADARLNEIKAALEKTLIRAPVAGVVLKLYRRQGETVTNFPPTLIATVGDTSRLRVKADIDQTDVARPALGQSVSITADAFPDKHFRGTVSHVAAQLGRKNFRRDNPEERTDTKVLEVLIDLEPGVQLPIGLPVDIRIDETRKPQKVSAAHAQANLYAEATGFRGPLYR